MSGMDTEKPRTEIEIPTVGQVAITASVASDGTRAATVYVSLYALDQDPKWVIQEALKMLNRQR